MVAFDILIIVDTEKVKLLYSKGINNIRISNHKKEMKSLDI